MTTTETQTTGEIPQIQPIYSERSKRVMQFSMPWLYGTIVVVLLLGFMGGLATQALFPATQGPIGHTGKQGVAGPVGPTGATGSAANVNLAAEGLCFNTSSYTFNDGVTPSFLTGAYLSTPTITNGTKSCPSGSFVPLEPAPGGPTQ